MPTTISSAKFLHVLSTAEAQWKKETLLSMIYTGRTVVFSKLSSKRRAVSYLIECVADLVGGARVRSSLNITRSLNTECSEHILNSISVKSTDRQLALHMADNRYCIEYAKTGRSGCKKCKSQIEKGVPRIGKITPNPFSDDGGEMKVWYHMRCMFETLKVREMKLRERKNDGTEVS